MGIYTNASFNNYTQYDYTSVEPFKGDHFNYHELGIIAAAECAANQNAFMKAIALQELASMEQYGNTEVLYESVDIKGIFQKIKAFFQKIIEKIHKIFHTFIAKLSSWFGNNKSFVQKYEKEVIKNWGLVKEDFEFKGYTFSHLNTLANSNAVTTTKAKFKDGSSKVLDILNAATDGTGLENALKAIATKNDNGSQQAVSGKDDINAVRDKLEEIKDRIRKTTIDAISGNGKTVIDMISAEFSIDSGAGLDSKEYTEELFKVFRSGEDTKQDLTKSKISTTYTSVNGLMTCIKDYDKIKTNLEKTENAMVKSIDDTCKALDKASDTTIKANNSSPTVDNEKIVSAAALVQSILGAVKEIQIQAFSAALQATKDQCSQAKEICVKVIGLSKKMTESTDYSESYSSNTGFNSFIENVKLV